MAQKTASATPSGEQSSSTTPSTADLPDTAAPSQPGIISRATASISTTGDRASLNESDQTRAQAASQPMSKSTSTGSDPSGKDAAAETASPYGTRSRYRTGSSRPNYAEDKDIDVDMYDFIPEKKELESKKSSRHAKESATSAQEHPRSNGSSRKTTSADDVKTHALGHSSKDATVANASGASQNAAHSGNAAPSKKRKAAAQASSTSASQSQSQSQSQTPAPPAATGGGSSRRSAPTTSQNSSGYTYPGTNMLSFSNPRLQGGALVADDGTSLKPNDNVYLVCEPPGEPYYLGRIMEFLHVQNDQSKPIDAIRINWFYRPKDIGKKVNDTRLVFATMHSDISPLTSLRGKCLIKHKAEIPKMNEYRRTPDCFWYEKLYDRYIQKNYDLIPTSQIVNVPEKVKKVLDERWKFIIVEQGRGKEFTSAVKLCKRCSGYCASNDSVDCAVCKNTYHMNCVRPPLLKKPSRGFAWSCAACSRAQERKLEARHTPNMVEPSADADEEELYDEEEEDLQGVDTARTSPANADDDDDSHRTGTAEQIYQASLWPWRYLGMHCKPEDALDYDDRIYPRASTRVGPRHQATVLPWPGRPVEYMKPLEYKKSGKKDSKMSKEAHAAYEAEKARREKLPKWFQDEPPGYVARGKDCDSDDPDATATLLWKPPSGADNGQEEEVRFDQYMSKAKKMASQLGLSPVSTNLQDVALETYFHCGYSADRALEVLSETEKAAFKEPELTPAEQKKFEEAVTKYGSELQLVTRHVKTVPYGAIARYYYIWKKTKQGRHIWGNFQNRKGKKEAKKAEAAANKLQDDIADDGDDSAFDAEKAAQKKKSFICKFCGSKSSRQWRRAPNASNALVTENGGRSNQKDKNDQYIQALCRRCAELWRRYAIQWEDLEEVAKKLAQSGNRAWKRKQDEELLKELVAANELLMAYGTPEPSNQPTPPSTSDNGATSGEPPRKKLKGLPAEKELDLAASDSGTTSAPQTKKKEKVVEKPAPPPVPEIPKPKTMPCAICDQLEPLGDQHLSCKECRLTVHRKCYGVVDNRVSGKWSCDMCMNDKNPQVSIHYKCVLCPVEYTEHDFVEAPKVSSHKKKSEKEKERERLEREQAHKAAEYYRKKQEELNRPVNPREPLKRTADNNWVHVTCAVWTPEVKFGTAKALSPSEGIPSIPRVRYDEVCKACGHKGGACVSCHHCKASVHVECARQHGYLLGFDITPIKGSRREQHSIVTIKGETGAMSAAIWCKEHVPTKTIVHRMHDIVSDDGHNALQLYVRSCKQADLTLTGTVRKANLIANATKMASAPITTGARRASTTNLAPATHGSSNGGHSESTTTRDLSRVCITCGIDTTPRWYRIDESDERDLANGHYGTEAQKFIEQRKFQCHKCRKAGRKPNPHPPPREPSPPPKEPLPVPPPLPLAQTPLAAPLSLRSPPPLVPSEPRRPSTSYPWGGPVIPPPSHAPPPPQHASPPGGPPPVMAAAPPIQVPGPPPTHSHHPAPGTGMPYGAPPGPRYPDWHGQPHPQLGSPPVRQVNGVGQAGGALGNLSALRPPPLSMAPVPPLPPAIPNGHHGPAMQNGLPPSPHRVDGHPPPMPHPSPFGHPYHHNLPPSHGMPNGCLPNGGPLPPPPPSRGPDSFPQNLLAQRTSFAAPHGSPPAPAPRDGPLAREAREPSGPLSTPNIRPSVPPRPAGASTSPSLRNLLS